MGVPKFFSWITKRYPLILQEAKQNSLPDIDYLYLDMNGIIYKCSKDESIIFKSMVMSMEMEQIWLNIFNYISNIVDIIQPKKLLFLGLDGVAPRAKMNNQRSRRYKSAKDYTMMEKRLNDYGQKNEENFKNNCITPGTQFMFQLNKQLRFFIQKKIHEDPDWQKFRVIFSGGDVPGEGEHKIMDFLREGVKQNIFDQNSKHCLYGADADLIMLAMTLPIKNLCIIRQQFIFNKNSKAINISSTKNDVQIIFQLIYITILKEYFQLQYQDLKGQIKVNYDIQKIINDFVFLCFFIGNDFLPRCYCYDIREGHIEILIQGFKQFLLTCENYLLGQQTVNLVELQRLTGILKKSEAKFIAARQQQLTGNLPLVKSQSLQKQGNTSISEAFVDNTLDQPMRNQKQFLSTLKTLYMNDDQAGVKKVFYETKFNLNPQSQDQQITKIIQTYLNGLNYVYLYYFKTLPSWEWFYPYYYAPLVNDLNVYLIYKNQNKEKLAPLVLSEPYEPFKQLLCILPKQSYGLLPLSLQDLIKSEQSPLRSPVDFFPSQVKIDPYGGKQQHEFISILPFIDQNLITRVYSSVDQTKYTTTQNERNVKSLNELYLYDITQPLTSIKSFYHYISDFKVSLSVKKIDFLKGDLRCVTAGLEKDQINKNLLEFPSLKTKKFKHHLDTIKKGPRTITQMQLSITLQKPEKDIKLGSTIFFGYPHQQCGKVLGICTLTEMVHDPKQFDYRDFFNQAYQTYNVRQIWQQFGERSLNDLSYKKAISAKQSDTLYFVMVSKKNKRKKSGKYIRNYENPEYRVIPNCIISGEKTYSFTKVPYVPSSLSDEFRLNQRVIVLSNDFCGYSGRVKGYSGNGKKVQVQLTQKLSKIPNQMIQKTKGNDFFWSLGFVCRIFEIDLDGLLTLIDSMPIQLDDTLPSAQKMPRAIDLGLNFIKRDGWKLVPTLVRLPLESQYVDNIFRQFRRLEISSTALQLLFEYYTKYPEIFHMSHMRAKNIKAEGSPNWRQPISANDIWQMDDPNKKAIQAYLWLIKQEQVHEPNSNINASKISKVRINNLLEYFKKDKRVKFSETEDFDPNCIFSARLAKEGLLYLRNQPPIHRIGDRVICLHPQQFGQAAIIIGIDTGQRMKDLTFQVLFQQPSFGKDDLGGLVDFLWGGSYSYQQLFNIDTWVVDIEPRDGDTKDRIGWDGRPPRFVNGIQNTRPQLVDLKNFDKIKNHLGLEKNLLDFIEEASKKKGADWTITTRKGQKAINRLQHHEYSILNPNYQPQSQYVSKVKEQSKTQLPESKVVGGKTFKKFDFNQTSNNTSKSDVKYVEKTHKTQKYVEKTQKVEQKSSTTKSNVLQKPKYVQKKIQESADQQKTEIKDVNVTIADLSIINPNDFNDVSVISQDQTLLVIQKQLNDSTIQPVQESEPVVVPPNQTVPTVNELNQNNSSQIHITEQQNTDPKEQIDDDIFG